MISKTLIIAEAGVNHNGNFDLALKLVDEAVQAGADIIKFQVFKTENIVTKYAPKADYQKKNDAEETSQFEMIKKLELSYDQFMDIKNYCDSKQIIFLATGDQSSLNFIKDLGCDSLKVPSGEITNIPYLRLIGSFGKKIILSTGMSTLDEIEFALNTLEKSGTAHNNITVLHCNTEYPTPFQDVNLNAMLTIKQAFNVEIGYSDHTQGIEVPIAAVAMGAKVIEKHFTIDKNLPGPDHSSSLEPGELKEMITSIRNIEKALGSEIKKPSPSEIKNLDIVRKSIVAKRQILKGEIFSDENITLKRPGNGISSLRWDEVIGKKAIKEFIADEQITLDE